VREYKNFSNPLVLPCAACGREFRQRTPNMRFCTATCREAYRRPLERALYDSNHKAERRRWRPLVGTGTVVCSWPGCGRRIMPWDVWDLGHLPDGSRSPQHAGCNRNTARVPIVPVRYSRAW
jgi:hypothetical protein